MKKWILLLFLIAPFFGCTSSSNHNSDLDVNTADANFKGLWKGVGQLTSTVIKPVACENIQMHLDIVESQLQVTKYAVACGPQFNNSLKDMTFEINGNDLLYKDNVVGNITERNITFMTTDSSNRGVTAVLDLQDDGTIQFTETAMQSGIEVLKITAKLENSGP
jgi:hypothetical protein